MMLHVFTNIDDFKDLDEHSHCSGTREHNVDMSQ